MEHHEPLIQQAAARAIKKCLGVHPTMAALLVEHLMDLFKLKQQVNCCLLVDTIDVCLY